MDIEDYDRDRAEKKLLMKLQEAEETVKAGEGWLSLDELKILMREQDMLELRINPLVATDLKEIRGYIAEDSEEYAAKTLKEIYGKFENIQGFQAWVQLFQSVSASGRIIIMRFGRIMLLFIKLGRSTWRYIGR